MRSLCACLAAALPIAVPGTAVPCTTAITPGLLRHVDAIQYGADPAADVLNLFMPTRALLTSLGLNRPAATLVIHGHGGHYDDSGFTAVCEHLAMNGIACASIDYPLADGVTTFVWDGYAAVNCALRWLRAHGGQYGYGAARIGVYGVSYGGLQAMWQVATPGMAQTPVLHQSVVEPGCPNAATAARVDAAVIQYGISDLRLVDFDEYLLGADHINATYETEFSPLTYLESAAVPQLVSVGDYDTAMSAANTGEWVRRLIERGSIDIYVNPADRSVCAVGAICGGPFTGLQQYWDLGGFGHGYEIFGATPNPPNHLAVPQAYSCAVAAFYWKALKPERVVRAGAGGPAGRWPEPSAPSSTASMP